MSQNNNPVSPTENLQRKRALLLIDIQNDFCPGGSLQVPQGDQILPVVNSLRKSQKWDLIVLTQDFHPKDHISFASNHEGKTVFETITLDDGTSQVMWPNHCVQGTTGTEFHKDLQRDNNTDIIVQKGKNRLVDSYSGFFDNNKQEKTELDSVLKKHNITDTYICGLALDYCVAYTAVDSAELGYNTYLVEDACRGIDPEGCKKALERMKEKGIKIVQSKDV